MSHIPTPYLTSAQMRALELEVIASGAVSSAELMERAGQGVVDATFHHWPELAQTSYRAVILCGPGNNGGDGYVIARLLRQWGWEVEALALGEPKRLPPDAALNYERWLALGEVAPLSEESFADALARPCDLLVDALFGSGLSRAVEGLGYLGEIALQASPHSPRVVAVDLPSGLSSDTGTLLGQATAPLPAHLTVTFHSAFLGHVLAEGPSICGALAIHDIGLSHQTPDTSIAQSATPDLALLRKGVAAHKFSHGHALILSGGAGKTGAARLAARGALRVGAGLVTLGGPKDAMKEAASFVTAIMLAPLESASDLTEYLADPRISALCIGPNFGLSSAHNDLLVTALASDRPIVLDADALTLLSQQAAPFTNLHSRVVLTPHMGEFARLFPALADRLTQDRAFSKADAAREAAVLAGCTVLLKGSDTVIADSTGQCRILASCYENATPWLATAGAGDVLAGIISGLLARGLSPLAAAENGAWLHAAAARSFGAGLIAEDLPEELPSIFRMLGV